MSANKNIGRICLIVLILTVLGTILFMNGEKLGIRAVEDEDAESYSGDARFTSNDLNGSWDVSRAVQITLNGDSASIRGNGAYFNDGSLTIKNGGYYSVTGNLTNGSIVVDAYVSSKVWILLNGVSVNCEDNAALSIKKADKVFLTLAEGTENTFTSGETYSDEALKNNTDAAVWSKEDLTINGSGTLRVNGEYGHGIKCNDSLVITGGMISISCPQDGIHANDSISFTNADVSVEAGDDAVHCDTKIYFRDGTLTASDCYEGIEAPMVEIAGGQIAIYPTDDGINANSGSDEASFMPGKDPDARIQQPVTETAQEQAEGLVYITGGSITIINENGKDADGIDSNGDIVIDGGEVLISLSGSGNNALDFGSENGGNLYLNGGTVVAAGDSSMLEKASDDSLQGNMTIITADEMSAGSLVTVSDAEDKTVLEKEIPGSFTAVTLSCSELAAKETYTVKIGEDYSVDLTLDTVSVMSGDGMVGFGGAAGRLSGMKPMMGGQMPEDFAEPESGRMPEEGQRPEGGPIPGDGQMPGMDQRADKTPDQAAPVQSQPVSAYPRSTRLLLGASGAVLVLGLAIVLLVKKRKGL